MAYKILKQFIGTDEKDPWWASRNVWVAILPDGNDKEEIYDDLNKAETEITKKKNKDKEKDQDGKDKKDKFGKKIKNRKYKIIEI